MNSGKSPQVNLLIVEKNQHEIHQYKVGLRNTPFEATFVTDGEQALVVYRQLRPDVILLDIMLPNMSGYSVLKRIRMELEDKKTPVIVVTALSRREDIIACAKLGISGYIVKPFDSKKIGEMIWNSFQKSRASAAEAAPGSRA